MAVMTDQLTMPAPRRAVREVRRAAPALIDLSGEDLGLTRRSRVLILNGPAVPAGAVPGRPILERLAGLVIAHDLVVVSDEAYEPFVYDGAVHHSIGALPGMAERTLTINGFSRAYAMAGWRVGYVAGHARLLGPMQQLKQALSICSPAVSQHAALAALTGPSAPVEEAYRAVAERRGGALAALEHAGVPHVRPMGGYFVLID